MLRVVADAPVSPAPSPHGLGMSLAASPFRPGELPALRWVALDVATADVVAQQASAARLPVELWLRLAVEASRVVGELAALTGRERTEIVGVLDAAAKTLIGEPPADVSSAALRAYAVMLERGEAAGRVTGTLGLRLSEELAGAWGRAAAGARQSLPVWVSEQLALAPAGAVGWEVAAARASRTLAEWAYASALRAIASSRP